MTKSNTVTEQRGSYEYSQSCNSYTISVTLCFIHVCIVHTEGEWSDWARPDWASQCKGLSEIVGMSHQWINHPACSCKTAESHSPLFHSAHMYTKKWMVCHWNKIPIYHWALSFITQKSMTYLVQRGQEGILCLILVNLLWIRHSRFLTLKPQPTSHPHDTHM